MPLIRQSPPAVLALDTTTLAEHLRLPHAAPETEQSVELTTLIRAATTAIERRLDAALIAQDWLWRTDSLTPPLPLAPLISVQSVVIVAPDDTRTPWTGWRIAHGHPRPGIVGRPIPALPPDGHFEVAFTAGYGTTPDAVPDDLRHAITLLAAHFYENREATTDTRTPLPLGVGSLLAPHREIRLS